MKTKKLLTWVAASTMLVGLAACNNKTPEPEPEPPEVTLEKIECTSLPGKLSYFVGEAFDKEGLEVTATYSDASTQKVSDYTLSLADGYEFTEEDFGNKQVKVTYQEKTADFTVKVLKVRLTGIRLDTKAVKAIYRLGEEFDPTGLVVYGQYNNGTEARVSGYTISQPDLSSYGEHEVYVDYEGYRATFTVEVRQDEWYEIIDTFLDEYGVEIDLPYDVLLSTGLEEAVLYVGEDDNGDDYLGLTFADLNPQMYSYLVYYLLVYYGIETTNFAFIGYDVEYYDYGYAQFNVMSAINEDGSYVEVNFVGCDEDSVYESYFDEEARFEMQIFFREAELAEDVAEEFTAALYGENSITKLQGEEQFIADFSDVAEYVAVRAERKASVVAQEEVAAFIEEMKPLAENAASFSDEYWKSGEDYVAFDYSPDQHDIKSMMDAMFAVLRYDFGFVPYMNPEMVDFDGDDAYVAIMLSPDGLFALQLTTLDYYHDGTLYFEIDVLYTDYAMTGYESYEVYLPLAGDEVAQGLLGKVNTGAYTVYNQWTSAYGYFVISEELNEEHAAAWIQVSASEFRNMVAFNVFENSPLWETEYVSEEAVNNYLHNYFGFKTSMPEGLYDVMPYTLFGMDTDEMVFQYQIFDNDDPGSEEYSGHALEDDVLAAFLADGGWDIDDSQYETLGYIATSKEARKLLPFDRTESVIKVTFYSWDYMFVMKVEVVEKTQAMPLEDIQNAITRWYGEEAALLDLEGLASALENDKFVVVEGEDLAEECEYIYMESLDMTDEAYDAFYELALELYNDEAWKPLNGIPSSSGTYAFEHTSGLIIEIYYAYTLDWSTFTYINYGYIYFQFQEKQAEPEPEPEPVEINTLEDAVKAFKEQGQIEEIATLPYNGFDNIEGGTLQYQVTSDTSAAVLLTLDEETATGEQITAFYNAAYAMAMELQAQYDAAPGEYWTITWNDIDEETPIEGTEHAIYYQFKYLVGDEKTNTMQVRVVCSQEYGMYVRIDLYGDFSGGSEPSDSHFSLVQGLRDVAAQGTASYVEFESLLAFTTKKFEHAISGSGINREDEDHMGYSYVQLTAAATVEEMKAFNDAQIALVAEISAAAEADPEHWQIYDYSGDDDVTAGEGLTPYYFIAYYVDDEGNALASYRVVFADDYGYVVEVDLAGEFQYTFEELAEGPIYNVAYYNWAEEELNWDFESTCHWTFDIVSAGSGSVVFATTVETLYEFDVLLNEVATILEEMGLEYDGYDEDYGFVFWAYGYAYYGYIFWIMEAYIDYSYNEETGLYTVTVEINGYSMYA